MIVDSWWTNRRIIDSVTDTLTNVLFNHRAKICYYRFPNYGYTCGMPQQSYESILWDIRDDLLRKMNLSDDIGMILRGRSYQTKQAFVNDVLKMTSMKKLNEIYQIYTVNKYPDLFAVVKTVMFVQPKYPKYYVL
jgi:hypothetical protein